MYPVKRFSPAVAGLSVLLMSLLSCRPIVAIGWQELIILIILIVILLGPLMFRLYRFIDKIQKASKAESKKRK